MKGRQGYRPNTTQTIPPTSQPRNTVKTASNGDDAPGAGGENSAPAAAGLPPKSPLPSAGLGGGSGSPATSPAFARFPRTAAMQSMSSLPDTRQQSFDEIYGPPENFLEIEVRCFALVV